MGRTVKRDTKEIMGLFYKRVDPYLYGFVQFFRPTDERGQFRAHRQSAPFVISQSIGEQEELVYGSVLELIREIRRLIVDLSNCEHKLRAEIHRSGVETNETQDSSGKRVVVTLAGGEEGDRVFFDYTRETRNILLLLSCQTRNLYEIFPRLNSRTVCLFDYEGKEVSKITVKELFDQFVHNRYLFVDGEHVADLFSAKFAKKSNISNMFMGYKIKWRDYVAAIEHSIDDVKIRDLTGLLKGRLKRLSSKSSHNDIVFLIQNLESLSTVLRTKIPTEKYSPMLNLLFDRALNEKLTKLNGVEDSVNVAVNFASPHVKIHEDLSEKKFRIQVRCKFSVGEEKRHVGRSEELEEFSRDVGYEPFFECVNDAFGGDALTTAM